MSLDKSEERKKSKERRNFIFEEWKKNVEAISYLFGRSKTELLVKKDFEKNFYEFNNFILSQSVEETRQWEDNHQVLVNFYIKHAKDMSSFIMLYLEKNEKSITIEFSYDKIKFHTIQLPMSQLSGPIPNALELFGTAVANNLAMFVANEKVALNHMADPKNKDYYYKLFSVTGKALKAKLKIWKDNYPKAYEYLVKNWEIPRYEEL